MNAQEARDTAFKINTDESNVNFKKAMDAIKLAVKKGEYECWVHDSMKVDLKDKLSTMGYTIGNTVSDRDGTMTKITW